MGSRDDRISWHVIWIPPFPFFSPPHDQESQSQSLPSPSSISLANPNLQSSLVNGNTQRRLSRLPPLLTAPSAPSRSLAAQALSLRSATMLNFTACPYDQDRCRTCRTERCGPGFHTHPACDIEGSWRFASPRLVGCRAPRRADRARGQLSVSPTKGPAWSSTRRDAKLSGSGRRYGIGFQRTRKVTQVWLGLCGSRRQMRAPGWGQDVINLKE